MIRWSELDAHRLRPQEEALLALCDRVQMLEQLFMAEKDRTRALRRQVDRMERTIDALQDVLERKG